MSLTLFAGPQGLPVTLTQMKRHLRVDHTDEDETIEALIRAATGYLDGADGILGYAMLRQTWDLQPDDFPRDCEDPSFVIPLVPFVSIDAFSYVDEDNVTQTFTGANYQVKSDKPARIYPAIDTSWPSVKGVLNPVTLRFTVGHEFDYEVPAALRQAIKLIAADWYENREGYRDGVLSRPVQLTAKHLYDPFRVWK